MTISLGFDTLSHNQFGFLFLPFFNWREQMLLRIIHGTDSGSVRTLIGKQRQFLKNAIDKNAVVTMTSDCSHFAVKTNLSPSPAALYTETPSLGCTPGSSIHFTLQMVKADHLTTGISKQCYTIFHFGILSTES